MKKIWADRAWEDYLWFQENDKKLLRKINSFIKEIERNPYNGIGKSEKFKGNLTGFYSRHIDDKNKVIYHVIGERLEIASCRGHYNDK